LRSDARVWVETVAHCVRLAGAVVGARTAAALLGGIITRGFRTATMPFSLKSACNGCGVRADAPIFPALTGAIVDGARSIHVHLVHGPWFGPPRADEVQGLSGEFEGVEAFSDSALSSAIVKLFCRHYHGCRSPGAVLHLPIFIGALCQIIPFFGSVMRKTNGRGRAKMVQVGPDSAE
jgi:hypothetical protein